MNTLQKSRGFTLIEILVVVVIIGILATAVVGNIIGAADEARVNQAKSDIQSFESALDQYKLDNFVYPTTDQGLEALVNKPSGSPEPAKYRKGGYVKRIKNDPWGRPYIYLSPGENGDVDIYSLGADGREGGEDENADIGNWNLQ